MVAPIIVPDKAAVKASFLPVLYNLSLNSRFNFKHRYFKEKVFFEVIFMTYSYIHKAINTEAFPNAINLYDSEKMKNRGLGKYAYKQEYREEGEKYLKDLLTIYFPKNKIIYFS